MPANSLEFKQFLSAFEPDLKNQLLKYGKIKNFSEDKIVLDIREQINYFPLIIKGLARVTRRDGQGNSILLHYLTPFDVCTVSFLNACQNKPNTIRITSKTTLVCYMFPFNLIKDWFFKYESWHKYIIKLAQEQNESLINLINEKVFEKLEAILKNYLNYLCDTFNTKLIVTSHQDIARDLYVSRESISRTLKKMENQGLLKLGRNKILLN